MNARNWFLVVSLVSGGALAQGSGSMQGAAQPGATPAAGGSALEEVVVTAQRREESLQNVPVAVSAFTATQLESRQIASTLDLVRIVPNLLGHNNTGTGTANTYFMRGLGSTEQIALIDPAVSTYVDDVIIPRQNANNYALFDVERLEVLRGPQGTTFGRNSTGGAINVITRKPADAFGGLVSLGGGNFGSLVGRGSVDIPLAPTLLTKLSGFYSDQRGWLNNLTNGERLNGSRNWGARVALRVLPTEALTWDVAAEYMYSSGIYERSIFGIRDDTRDATTQYGSTRDLIGDMLNRRHLHNAAISRSATSSLGWHLSDALNVDFITGYRDVGQTFILDFSTPTTAVTPGPFLLNNDGKYEMFSQEIKANGALSDRVRYVGGLFYFYETNITKAGQAFFPGSSATAIPAALPAMSCSLGFAGDGNMICPQATNPTARGYSSWRDIRNKTYSYAAYAQFDVKLTDRLTGVLGARYTDEKKKLDLQPTPFGGLTNANLIAAGIPVELKSSLVTPRVGLNFQATPEVLLYASATRGFKSGGWNSRTAYRPQEFTPMQPEKTWSYEAGVKSELFDRRLRLNATAFVANTRGLQLSYTTPGPPPTPTLSIQDNAGDIRVKGAELEFAARATEWFDLYGSVGYETGEYTSVNPRAQSFCTNGGSIVGGLCANPRPPATSSSYVNAIDITDVPSRLPKWTGALGLNFNVPLPALRGSLRFTLEGDFNSGYWTTASNSNPFLSFAPGVFITPTALDTYARSYTLYNASAGYVTDDQRLRVMLECKNCSDKSYLTSVFGGGFYGDPRRYMGTVTVRFGATGH